MGNCLDIPPLAPKSRPSSQTNSHRSVDRTLSVDPGSTMSDVYSAYQLYRGIAEPPPTVVAINPFTGLPYSYQAAYSLHVVEMSPSSEQLYTFPLDIASASSYRHQTHLSNRSYSSRGYAVELQSWHKKRHSHREARSQNGEPFDRNSNIHIGNANFESTIISTFADPQEDIIRRGHEIIVSTGASSAVGSTITHGSIKLTTASASTSAAAARVVRTSSIDGNSAINQDRVIQKLVRSAPVATHGSTYVTYIQQEEPPPRPELTETIEILEDRLPVQLEEDEFLEEENRIVFDETGSDFEENAVQLFIDEPDMPTVVVKKTTPSFVSSDWFKTIGCNHRSRVPHHDVTLCYDSVDADVMGKAKKGLESAGFSLDVSDVSDSNLGNEILDWQMFSQAVIDSKIMVVILSLNSVKNKHLSDEVSLAHVTDTSVYPVGLGPFADILAAMEIPLKLQLASRTWTDLAEGDNTDLNLQFLVRNVKEELAVVRHYHIIDEDFGEVSSWAQRSQTVARRRQLNRSISRGNCLTAFKYWDKLYASGVHSVPWEIFYKDLRREYKELMKSVVPLSCTPYLMESLKRELGVNSEGLVHRAQFIEFCTEVSRDQDVWEKVRNVAKETQAVRDVFDHESTVRIVAMENIGKFCSQSVVLLLRELLRDRDINIRAAAIISLSRCSLAGDQATFNALMETLEDKDKRVREAGCLALGRLRAHEAVEKLTTVWQCDVISEVKDAARSALKEIGGSDVINIKSITNSSADEILF